MDLDLQALRDGRPSAFAAQLRRLTSKSGPLLGSTHRGSSQIPDSNVSTQPPSPTSDGSHTRGNPTPGPTPRVASARDLTQVQAARKRLSMPSRAHTSSQRPAGIASPDILSRSERSHDSRKFREASERSAWHGFVGAAGCGLVV
jgi:hypothetical protein